MSYDHKTIEAKWRKFWDDNQTFKCDVYDFSKPKYYALDMFPFPSSQGLHVGHPEGYTATDIVSRMKRMQGFNVLHPMGWDAFGLPAEQYAIAHNEHPEIITRKNIDHFRQQIKALGMSVDWSKEIATCDPSYYKWTQWIFVKMFENDLAYVSDIPVNYCEELGTVLANEEVVDGKSERGGYPVKREGSQGQCKTYLVALKLAQFLFLKQTGRRQTPLLLLDDVFDKLDSRRVAEIVRLVADADYGQIFLTDTNREHLDRILEQSGCDHALFRVDEGRISHEAE